MTIVRNLQKLQPAVLNKNLQGGGPSVNSILDELFQRMNRGNDNLTSGNLVNNVWVKCLRDTIRRMVM
jgi:hypothetical protein